MNCISHLTMILQYYIALTVGIMNKKQFKLGKTTGNSSVHIAKKLEYIIEMNIQKHILKLELQEGNHHKHKIYTEKTIKRLSNKCPFKNSKTTLPNCERSAFAIELINTSLLLSNNAKKFLDNLGFQELRKLKFIPNS